MLAKRCRECNKAILGSLDLHFRGFHRGEVQPYLCMNESSKFALAQRKDLEKHEKHCRKEKEYACDQCDLKMKGTTYLKRPKDNVHSGAIISKTSGTDAVFAKKTIP